MADVTPLIHSFNAGEISKAALNRIDLDRTRLNAEIQENLFPYAIGKAIIRPGTEYLGRSLNARSRIIPFAKTLTAKAILELGVDSSAQGKLRVWIDGVLVTRPAVSAAITNGSFSSSTGWTSTLTGDASASFSAGLQLTAPSRGSKASVTQQVSVSEVGAVHALGIVVAHGPVHFRCGSAVNGADYIADTTLDEGVHSLAFTPTGSSFWVEFYSKQTYAVQVTSITVEAAGTMEVVAPWNTDELRDIRYDTSLDVIFLARNGERQYKIERRATESWSVVRYQTDDGPFTIARTADITLKPGATFGNTTLTASEAFFQSGHVGALFRLNHEGSVITCGLSAQDEFTENIRVVGIHGTTGGLNNERQFTVTVTGTWSGTLTIERSFDGPDSGFKSYATISANGTTTKEDQDDNAIIYYRVRFTTYISGTAYVTLTYAGDGGSGIVRITSVASDILANAEVLADLRDVSMTKNWLEGEWSDKRGYPTANTFFDGRLFWARSDRFWGSVSGDYYGFSLDVVGDSGSIQRDVATGGGLADINWLLPLQRLIFGTAGETVSARTSNFDEPLTPTNITLKAASTQGAAPISPLRIDSRGVYVQRSTTRLYELLYDIESNDYRASSLVRQHEALGESSMPDLFDDGFVELALQRQPETYIWSLREDGQAPFMIYESEEKVAGWIRMRTGYIGKAATADDRIISLCVLSASGEDETYLLVERNIVVAGSASIAYCMERLRPHSEIIIRYDGSTRQNGLHLVDSYITFTADGTANQTVTGLDQLCGNAVIAVGQKDGKTYNSPTASMFIVNDAGAVTLNEAFEAGTTVAIGRPYEGRYLSSKLAYGGKKGTAKALRKKINGVSLELLPSHWDAIRMGRSLNLATDDRFADRGVSFGGTPYLVRSGGLTGAADSQKLTFSCWVRVHTGLGGRLIASAQSVGGGGFHTRVVLGQGTNAFSMVGNNSSDITILNINSSTIPFADWVHVIGSADLSDTSKVHIYVNDVSDLAVNSAYVNDTIDFTMADWSIGGLPDGTSTLSGDIADLWFAPGVYLDLSVEANRRLFVDYDNDNNLIPVDLGSDGSVPTGTAPLVFMSGAASNWATNKGTGGGFTAAGGTVVDSIALPIEDNEMDELPRIKEDGTPVDPDAAFDDDIDETLFSFPGEWGADPRLAIQVRPGYSATLSALVIDVDLENSVNKP